MSGVGKFSMTVAHNFFGELNKLKESKDTARPLLVDLRGGDGLSASILDVAFNWMALPFHSLISSS